MRHRQTFYVAFVVAGLFTLQTGCFTSSATPEAADSNIATDDTTLFDSMAGPDTRDDTIGADSPDTLCRDSECDDGVYCNGNEFCGINGACQEGLPIDCVDTISCTADYCDEARRTCAHPADNGLCAIGEFCDASSDCRALPRCVTQVDCDDGQPCTDEVCINGACQFVPFDVRCDAGDYCVSPERCAPFLGCLPGSTRDCDDADDCTTDQCDAGGSRCLHALRDADGDGVPALACGGADCDDDNLAVAPGQTDVCNGIDDDCDGVLDEDDPFGATPPTVVAIDLGASLLDVQIRADALTRWVVWARDDGTGQELLVQAYDALFAPVWAEPLSLGTVRSASRGAFEATIADSGTPGSPGAVVVAAIVPGSSAGLDTVRVWWVSEADGITQTVDVATDQAGVAGVAADAHADVAIAWIEGYGTGPTVRVTRLAGGVAITGLDAVIVSEVTTDPTGELSVLARSDGVVAAWLEGATTPSLHAARADQTGGLDRAVWADGAGATLVDAADTASGGLIAWSREDGSVVVVELFDGTPLASPTPQVIGTWQAGARFLEVFVTEVRSGVVFERGDLTPSEGALVTVPGALPIRLAPQVQDASVAFDGRVFWALTLADSTGVPELISSACR